MNIEIKKAKLDDIELLIKWRMKVLSEVFSISSNQSLKNLEYENRIYYQNALSKEKHIACFAYVDNKVVGCGGVCFYRELPSPDNINGNCAYLMNIYTRPEFRGQGIGGKIVNWLVQQAQNKKVMKIYLEASEYGYSLYQKLGFHDMYNYMKLKNNL